MHVYSLLFLSSLSISLFLFVYVSLCISVCMCVHAYAYLSACVKFVFVRVCLHGFVPYKLLLTNLGTHKQISDDDS